VIQPGIIRLIAEADQKYQLTQRERIALAMLAQTEGLSAVELTGQLELDDQGALRPWIGRLQELGLVEQAGRTKGTRYFVPPAMHSPATATRAAARAAATSSTRPTAPSAGAPSAQ
jgi:ATP-dependent DNA helicase RecG